MNYIFVIVHPALPSWFRESKKYRVKEAIQVFHQQVLNEICY